MKTNRKYLITILDEMFGALTGEFIATSENNAKAEAKEYYALELDCDAQDIKIIKSKEV